MLLKYSVSNVFSSSCYLQAALVPLCFSKSSCRRCFLLKGYFTFKQHLADLKMKSPSSPHTLSQPQVAKVHILCTVVKVQMLVSINNLVKSKSTDSSKSTRVEALKNLFFLEWIKQCMTSYVHVSTFNTMADVVFSMFAFHGTGSAVNGDAEVHCYESLSCQYTAASFRHCSSTSSNNT